VLAHLVRHLSREPGSSVEHGEHDAEHLQPRVQHSRHQTQRRAELGQPFEGVELTLNRDNDRLRRHQAVDGEQAEGGRAIQQHVVIPIRRRRQAAPQPALPRQRAHQFDLGASQIDRRRNQVEAGRRCLNGDRVEGTRVAQAVVDGSGKSGLIDAEPAGGVALGVHVNQ